MGELARGLGVTNVLRRATRSEARRRPAMLGIDVVRRLLTRDEPRRHRTQKSHAVGNGPAPEGWRDPGVCQPAGLLKQELRAGLLSLDRDFVRRMVHRHKAKGVGAAPSAEGSLPGRMRAVAVLFRVSIVCMRPTVYYPS